MNAVAVHARVDPRGLDLVLEVPDARITALVGPNGSGKTSLLHLVAGLLGPTGGTVTIGDRTVSRPGLVVPAHRRGVALLTQRPALFPHLSVVDNVAFGPRAAGLTIRAARSRALAELDAVGCAAFAERRPQALSGGEAQRVAIARALATDPAVVLLDEPLASLDVAVAPQVRHILAQRLRGRTALLVTHELLDIWSIADAVAVLSEGRVVESGPVPAALVRPTSAFLARLSGTNLFTGIAADETSLTIAPGTVLRGLADPAQPPRSGEPGLASVQPAAVALHLADPSGSPRNVLAGVVAQLEPRGAVVRVTVAVAGQTLAADLTSQAVAEMGLRPGMAVRAAIKATQVRLYGR